MNIKELGKIDDEDMIIIIIEIKWEMLKEYIKEIKSTILLLLLSL